MVKLKWPTGLPLIGGLGYCALADHWRASQKVGFELVFATLPLSLGAMVIWLNGAASGFWKAGGGNVGVDDGARMGSGNGSDR